LVRKGGFVILLALAALAQAPDAAAAVAARDHAMTCAVVSVVDAGLPTVTLASYISYYAMIAARADPQGKPFMQRAEELMDGMSAYAEPWRDGANRRGVPGLLAECDRRYPLARSSGSATLPVDLSERDLLCFSILNIARGMGDGAPPGTAPTISQSTEVSLPRRDDLLLGRRAEARVDDATMEARATQLLAASTQIGNAETISRACIAAL
jgi:hypothetical protein